MRSMKRIAGCIAIAAIAVLAGCSRSATPPNAVGLSQPRSVVPGINPCTLVTVDEVSAAMGKPSQPGVYHKAFNGDRCNFNDATMKNEIFLQTVDPKLMDALLYTQHLPVKRIGDRAIWSNGSLYVQKGKLGMQVGFFLPHPLPALTPAAKELVRVIVSRMP